MGQEGAWRSFDGTHQEDAFRYAEDVGQTSLVCTGQLESLLIYSILVSTLLMYVMRVRNTAYSLFSLNYYLVVITGVEVVVRQEEGEQLPHISSAPSFIIERARYHNLICYR